MSLDEFDSWYRSRYRRTSSALTSLAFIVADLLAAMLSFGAGFFLVNLYDPHAINFRSFVLYWPYLPGFIFLFWVTHLYPGLSLAPAEEMRRFSTGSLLSHAGLILSLYVQHASKGSVSVAFGFSFLLSMVAFPTCRAVMRDFNSKRKWWGVPAVVFGAGKAGRAVVDSLLDERRLGYIPVAMLDDDPSIRGEYRGVPILGGTELGPRLVELYRIRMAIVAMPGIERVKVASVVERNVLSFRYYLLIPDLLGLMNIWMTVRDFNGLLGLGSSQRLLMPWNLAVKRILDVGFTVIGGIIISPIILLIALLIRIDSPGPVFYGHKRLGMNGRSFKAWKFRSMVSDADARLRDYLAANPQMRAEWERSFKLKDDPRITRVGRVLRRLSLDELPQIWNVIRGEMSLVGPRPIVEAEVPLYGSSYERFSSMMPGMTGLWQVSGRSDTDYEERVAFDRFYNESWSVWLDLNILFRTFQVIFRGKGAY
jgi:Undecaprenyl-phosphate galactose phosphotransferase WbaP